MSGYHYDGGEQYWHDHADDGFKTLDELSREETLRSLAGLDQQIEADNEKDTYSLLARGLLHTKLGDDRRAVEEFSRVIELEPNNAEALENRATARDALGEHRLAREDHDALLRLEPDNAVALYSRGACLARMGDLAGAVADFERVIELEPGDAVRYYNRGCIYAELDDPYRAQEDFDQAISLNPGNHIFHHYRGIAHRELGEFDQAVSNPDNADALGGQGMARSALGNHFSRNVRKGPDSVRQKCNPNFPSARLSRSLSPDHTQKPGYVFALFANWSAIALNVMRKAQ